MYNIFLYFIYIFFRSSQRISSLTENSPFPSLTYLLSLPALAVRHAISFAREKSGGRRQRKDQNRGIVPRSSRLFIRTLSLLSSASSIVEYSASRPSSILLSSFSASFLMWPRPEFAIRNVDVCFIDKCSFRDDVDIYSPKYRI